MPPGAEPPPLQFRCRVCGYDLSSIDWHRAGYHCPECGQINIPGDANVAPLTDKPWPGTFLILLIVLWPGILTGVFVGLHGLIAMDWSAMLGVFTGLIGAVLCLTWPWAAAEILMFGRVHQQRRSRFMPWLPLAGMVGNIMLATALARVMYLLG